jgi:hypothetical protein
MERSSLRNIGIVRSFVLYHGAAKAGRQRPNGSCFRSDRPSGVHIPLDKRGPFLDHVNVNTITINLMDAAVGSYEADRKADVRGHEAPRIVSWSVARRVEKAAREPGGTKAPSKGGSE